MEVHESVVSAKMFYGHSSTNELLHMLSVHIELHIIHLTTR